MELIEIDQCGTLACRFIAEPPENDTLICLCPPQINDRELYRLKLKVNTHPPCLCPTRSKRQGKPESLFK
jgi:hypothetical protein